MIALIGQAATSAALQLQIATMETEFCYQVEETVWSESTTAPDRDDTVILEQNWNPAFEVRGVRVTANGDPDRFKLILGERNDPQPTKVGQEHILGYSDFYCGSPYEACVVGTSYLFPVGEYVTSVRVGFYRSVADMEFTFSDGSSMYFGNPG